MIGIFQGSMTAKERVLRTFNHEKADRVPVNYLANPAIHKRVAAALGVPADKDAAVSYTHLTLPTTERV